MPDILEYILGGAVLLVMALGFAAKRLPHVEWLQAFDFKRGMTPEQQARARRRADLHSGAQLILLALALPLGYVGMTVIFFNAPTRGGLLLTGAASLVIFGLGVAAIASSRRR